jgi:hypothetical protein
MLARLVAKRNFSAATAHVGKVSQVIGAVVDV